MADTTVNATKWTTILGLVQAAAVAIVDFIGHNSMEGGALKQPTFWLGLLIAAAMGLKGYLTQGTPSAGTTVVTTVDAPKQ